MKKYRNFLLIALASLAMVGCEVDVTVGGEEGGSSSSSENSSGTMTDARDNQTYRIVTIGSRTWMAENLNYDYNKGSAESYCYANEEAVCERYGRLYTWAAAMDSAAVFSNAGKGCGMGVDCNLSGTVRGVCPKGWHLPSMTEWDALFTAARESYSYASSLRSTSDWIDGKGTDDYGFSALPAGLCLGVDACDNMRYDTYFWSATQYGSERDYAYYSTLSTRTNRLYLEINRRTLGYSVRCVKD